jgi:hypothetical protein
MPEHPEELGLGLVQRNDTAPRLSPVRPTRGLTRRLCPRLPADTANKASNQLRSFAIKHHAGTLVFALSPHPPGTADTTPSPAPPSGNVAGVCRSGGRWGRGRRGGR